jgi:hypothetical protein
MGLTQIIHEYVTLIFLVALTASPLAYLLASGGWKTMPTGFTKVFIPI